MIELIVLDVLPVVMHTVFYTSVVIAAVVGAICVFGELVANGIHDY